MASTATENYLKQIYTQEQRAPGDLVPMGRLAEALGVVPGTATAMVKKLADSELVAYEPYSGVKLTCKGRHEALRVLRRHRLVEAFLVEILGLDWSVVHEEAERLEHAISDRVLKRIDAVLGHPRVDPHGDPIPDDKGEVNSARTVRLTDCEIGYPLRIVRVVDQDEAFLRFADRHGLKPGCVVEIREADPVADSVVLKPALTEAITLGRAAAAKLLVETNGLAEGAASTVD